MPLSDVRVIELPAIGPVPFCGMQLADMGADVVRIDRRASAGLGIEVDARFDVLGRGKRSIALDLKNTEDLAVARELAARADILIEGFRPGVAERLGLGPEDCRALNPRLVYGRICGFGRNGPHRDRAGHDIGYLALAGVLAATGPAALPSPPLNLVGDFGGAAMMLLAGLLAALHARHASGEGTVVDCSILGGATALTPMLHGLHAAGRWTLEREANVLDGGAPYYRCYATCDGGFMSVGAIEARFYAALLDALDLRDEIDATTQHDTATWPATAARFAAVFATRSRDAWTAHFADVDACVEPVLNLVEAQQHPQAASAYVDIDGVPQPSPYPCFADSTPRPPPKPGEHADEIIAELRGDASR